LQRTRLLVGQEGLDRLAALNVLLVGLGGVGSFAAELLCRAGVGAMTIVVSCC
jgi:tRNA A37 threonylcarbamoyladenosine dehydratase